MNIETLTFSSGECWFYFPMNNFILLLWLVYQQLTRTALLVRGERYISIQYTRSPHEQLGLVVI